ncbi:MAG: hypothetical protein WB630_05365 [Candidatus Acidiferrales bacterium]
MKPIPNSISPHSTNLILTLAALFLVVVPCAFAKSGGAKSSDEPATVIAHIVLPGAPPTQILLQQQKGKQYLYLVRSSRKGFTVVDVTKPSEPNLIKRVAWPDGGSAGSLELVGGTLGLAEGSSARSVSMPAESYPKTIELLDLSDPANPRTVQSFSGVTSVLTDEARRLIYITNSDGLWIVKRRPQKFTLSPCASDDFSAAMPMCE